MKGPQLEDGYTRIANEILEVVSKVKFNGTQFKILITIWRYTYGFNRKDSEFSLNFLSEAMNANKQQVKRELDKLIEDNVIIVVKEAGFNSSRKLGFNKNYTEWKVDGIQSIKKNTVSELEYTTVSELEYTTVSELEYQERQYKDNIKKDTITTIDEGQPKIVNNENPVADIGADPIQQEEESVARVGADPTKQINPVEEIEKAYLKIRNRNMCSSNDMVSIVEAHDRYKDPNFIIKTMQLAVKENRARNGRLTINSFSYFMPIFEEEWEKFNLQKKKEGAKDEPIRATSGQNIKFDKSQFLWNGGENSI